MTNERYIFHVQAELKTINAQEAHIITEPMGKNTAPAIALAQSYCQDVLQCDDDEILFVSPSDHLIKPIDAFQDLIRNAQDVAKDNIVTLGIKPTKPEIGYGYIEAEKNNNVAKKVISFKEKPDLATAEEYIASGNYYWNGGMFMFSIATMQAELTKYMPSIIDITQNGYQKYTVDNFVDMPDISIDYAVAEKSQKMMMIPMENIYWNDIGSFDAIAEVLSDKDKNVFKGDILAENSHRYDDYR